MASAATLPWLWVIEALADLKQADTSLLKALIARAPSLLAEAPGPVRERVALRYLEECAGSGGGDGAAPDPSVSGVGFDAGLSSEEALCRHLREVTTLGNNEKHTTEPLKRDLHQFVLRKKATLPKSSLELLKESILEGCQQSVSSLKECSGLDRSDQVDHLHEDTAEEFVCVKRLKLSTDNGRIQSQKQTPAALACDSTDHFILQESPGSGQDLHEQNILDVDRENNVDDDNVCTSGNNGQLLKQTSNSQPPFERNDRVQDASLNGSREHVSSPFCQKGPNVEPNVIRETPSDGDGCPEISPYIDPNVKVLATERQQLLSSQMPVNHDSMTNNYTEKGLCIKCDRDGQLLICSSSGCSIAVHESCLGSVAHFEETGLFYCPFCSYTRAFNAYRKVRKSYSRARKALSAFIGKDLTSGLQKNLPPARALGEVSQAEFIREKSHDCSLHSNQYEKNTTTANEQQKQVEFFNMHEQGDSSSRDAQIRLDGRRHDVSHNAERINNHKDITKVQHRRQTDRDDVLNNGKLPHNGTRSSLVHETCDANLVNRQNDVGNGCECDGLAEQQELPEPHVVCDDGNLPANKEDISHTGDACDVKEPKGKCRISVGNAPLDIRKAKNQEQETFAMDHETINSLEHDGPTSRISWRYAKRTQQGAATEEIQPTQGTMEDQNREKSSPGNHSKRQIRSKRYSNPIIPLGRRTKLHWTSEEEECLKIAVQKFAVNSDGVYPWTKILEFGRHVFHKTRQPGDLKDKWRNIKIKEGLKAK